MYPFGVVNHCNLPETRRISTVSRLEQSCGIWRDMFLTQPPCKSISVLMVSEQRQVDFHYRPGFRLRHLCKALQCDANSFAGLKGAIIYINSFAIEGSPEFEASPLFDPLQIFRVSKCKVVGSKVHRPAQLPSQHTIESDDSDSDWESGESMTESDEDEEDENEEDGDEDDAMHDVDFF